MAKQSDRMGNIDATDNQLAPSAEGVNIVALTDAQISHAPARRAAPEAILQAVDHRDRSL